MSKTGAPGADGPGKVDELLASLDHPQKEPMQALRQVILQADPEVQEGIKWNAPSVFYRDWFATFNLRSRDPLQVILHAGAKAKGITVEVSDPHGLLKRLAPDRCLLSVTDMDQQREAVAEIIREWLPQMRA